MAAAKKCRRLVLPDVQSMAAAKKCRRLVLPDVMVWEILTWLPTKSLMRFKSVSKLWLSTILDPKFARARRAIFRGLLTMNPDPYPVYEQSISTSDFYFANFDGGESNNASEAELNFSFQFSLPEVIRNEIPLFKTSNIMNGIICFYDRNVSKLFNIATREIINLPESRCAHERCQCHLLFDPIQSVYKLLRICPNSGVFDYLVGIHSIECEILTLGVDLSWRSIQPPPHHVMVWIRSHGICVDGILHLTTLDPYSYEKDHYSFHVTGEKFQSVNYPKHFFLHLPAFGLIPVLATCYGFNPNQNQFVIAVADYREGSWTDFNKYTVNMGSVYRGDLMVEDVAEGEYDDHDDVNTGSSGGVYVFDNSRPNEKDYLNVRGSLPNGNLMISTARGVGTNCAIYLFDKTKNYLQKYILTFSASIHQRKRRRCRTLIGGIFWYEENIVSLKTLTGFSTI